MLKWRRWIRPALGATFLLTAVALFVEVGPVRRDLAERVASQLAADGQGWANVEVSGRSVTIGGTAPSTESQEIATRSAAAVRGVLTVSDRSNLLPLASPFVWTAKKSGPSVSVGGSVPSEAFRVSVLAAARRALPDAEIHDGMTLARGAPAGFGAGTAFALQRLAGLAEGMATMTDGVLAFTGTATDPASYRAAREALAGAMPRGLELGPVDILPARADPFVWSADFDGKAITISGFVPDELVHDALVATARKTLPAAPVLDKTVIASGAPDGFFEAANYALSALTRFSQGGVTLDGLRLDIAGKARSVDDYEAVLGAFAANLPKGVSIVSSALAPASVSPYGFKGVKTEGTVTLTGYVPSAAEETAILNLARALYGEARIVDEVRVASGEPRMDWLGAVKFAMGQLQELARGTVELSERSYAIEGEAASAESYAAILDANKKTLPASLTLKTASIAPPVATPYRFLAARQGGAVVLDGYAASEDDHNAILAAARRKFGGLEIVDRLAYAGGAPDGYVAAASAAMQAVSRLAAGRGELVDSELTISGGAYHPAAEEEVATAAAETLPKGFAATAAIRALQPGQPVSPERCRDLLGAELQAGRIDFDDDKSEIADRSFGMLDRVAAVLQRCPEASISIAAHTDSDGSTSRNRDLSQARATAIVEYLVGAGVRRERLTGTGFGESKPIADNSTDEGKARNRRIEFTMTVRGDPAVTGETSPGNEPDGAPAGAPEQPAEDQ
jgi:outer membrane protein OmpA-like peptidoglycan-associated protein/osmotically-inducible protein OsmY